MMNIKVSFPNIVVKALKEKPTLQNMPFFNDYWQWLEMWATILVKKLENQGLIFEWPTGNSSRLPNQLIGYRP